MFRDVFLQTCVCFMILNTMASEAEGPIIVKGHMRVFHSDNFEEGSGEVFGVLTPEDDHDTSYQIRLQGVSAEEELNNMIREGTFALRKRGNSMEYQTDSFDATIQEVGPKRNRRLRKRAVTSGSGSGLDKASLDGNRAGAEERSILMMQVRLADGFLPCDPGCMINNMWKAGQVSDSAYDTFVHASNNTLFFPEELGMAVTVNLTKTQSAYSGCNVFQLARDALAAVTEVDPADYDHHAFIIPKMDCQWSGLGEVDCDISQQHCEIWLNDDTARVLSHELGHNVGMGHARRGSNTYGDCSDIMGCGIAGFNAPHRMFMRWYPDDATIRVQRASTSECSAGSQAFNVSLRAAGDVARLQEDEKMLVIIPGVVEYKRLYISLRTTSVDYPNEPGDENFGFANLLSVHECDGLGQVNHNNRDAECSATSFKSTYTMFQTGLGLGVSFELIDMSGPVATVRINPCVEVPEGFGKCGNPVPISSCDCPENLDLPTCLEVGTGELCEGDGECGTDNNLNNCGSLGYDMYRKEAYEPQECELYDILYKDTSSFITPPSCSIRRGLTDETAAYFESMGFEFPYFCKKYSVASIYSNGYISLLNEVSTSACLAELGTCGQDLQEIPLTLAASFADLDPGAGGEIRYFTTNTSTDEKVFVVSFSNVPLYLTPTTRFTFQTQLFESGKIVFTYSNASALTGRRLITSDSPSKGKYILNSTALTVEIYPISQETQGRDSSLIELNEKISNLTETVAALQAEIERLQACPTPSINRGKRYFKLH
eukprot:m.336199 g.336199  ORF g.336199 m.336199 type:complete len:772 (+) comp17781_c0_seq1:341-2656(+)